VKSILAFGVVALAITACGDNGSAAPAPVTEAVATSPSPTTVVVPAPTTTEPIPTTTLPPTTTTVATEDLIKQAVQDYVASYFACGQEPGSCDPAAFTADTGHSREIVSQLVTGMIANGMHFSPDLHGSYIKPIAVRVIDASEATVESCSFDAVAVLGPIGPDGEPTVVNDEERSSRYSHSLVLEDGIWRVAEQSMDSDLGEGDACASAT